MAITDWDIADRPREKLLTLGSGALTDAELLAIFLRTGVKGKSAVDLARDLLSQMGGLNQLLSANQTTFCENRGLGQAKYAQLQAVLEMSRRYLQETMSRGDVITNIDAVKNYLRYQLKGKTREVFACLFLDTRHQVITYEELFYGSIDGASVHPRIVVKRALELNAAAVIFAHNHPSGISDASQADHHITQQLIKALMLVEIRVLDHFIIGDKILSFAEQGYI